MTLDVYFTVLIRIKEYYMEYTSLYQLEKL